MTKKMRDKPLQLVPIKKPLVIQAQEFYEKMGFSVIPLAPGDKKPFQNRKFTELPNKDLWQNVDPNCNIGIRCGGENNLVVIDCDDKNTPGTFSNVMKCLISKGFNPMEIPLIKTPSQNGVGRHIYLQCPEIGFQEKHYFSLPKNFGAGEVRFGENCYVVAPPSMINDSTNLINQGRYEKMGNFISVLPEIKFDELNILCDGKLKRNPSIERLPKKTRELLLGKGLDSYQGNRSAAEQAILTSMANCKMDFAEVMEIFLFFPGPGKFKEKLQKNPKVGEEYLKRSYQNAVQFAQTNISPGRTEAMEAEKWALNVPWPGKAGSGNRAAFLAHCKIAQEAGNLTYQTSFRRLAEEAGFNDHSTARNTTKRLIDAGYIYLIKKGHENLGNSYKINENLVKSETSTKPHSNKEQERNCVSISCDSFRYGALGKTGHQIINELSKGPKTKEELIINTGKCKSTVENWLKRMLNIKDEISGISYPIIELDKNKKLYSLLDNVDFDKIADFFGSYGKGIEVKIKHKRAREKFNSISINKRIFEETRFFDLIGKNIDNFS